MTTATRPNLHAPLAGMIEVRRPFHWCFLRYVPNPLSGECINMGMIVGNDDDGYRFRAVNSLTRLRRFNAHHYEEAVGIECELLKQIKTEDDLTHNHQHQWGIVQVSAPMPVMAASHDGAFDLMWRMLELSRMQEEAA